MREDNPYEISPFAVAVIVIGYLLFIVLLLALFGPDNGQLI